MATNLIFKLLGAALIVVGTTLFGKTYAKIFKDRVDFLTDFNKRLEIVKNEIGFMKGILVDVINRAGEFPGSAKELFEEMRDNLEHMEACSAWETACEKIFTKLTLKDEDVETVRSLGRLLGVSDVDGQITNIEAVSGQVGVLIESAETERKKNEPLFKSLGPLVGVGIAIFLM